MTTFVLVHGAWHGAWCWSRVKPLLERAGHIVHTPDLPSVGRRDPDTVSFQRWCDDVANTIDTASEKVVLVGHSRGGAVISQVAEMVPERIDRLIYLTAFLLGDGQSIFDIASLDEEALIGSYIELDDATGHFTIRDEGWGPVFFGDCSEEDIRYAKSLLVPEPAFGLTTPVKITAERFGRVPRSYIECMRDRAISLHIQQTMQATWPCERRITLDADHSPFLSRPDELATTLLALAAA